LSAPAQHGADLGAKDLWHMKAAYESNRLSSPTLTGLLPLEDLSLEHASVRLPLKPAIALPIVARIIDMRVLRQLDSCTRRRHFSIPALAFPAVATSGQKTVIGNIDG
jgi:hypothetical protein